MVELSGERQSLKPGESVPKPPNPRSEAEIIAQWKGNIAEPLVSVVCHTFNHQEFIEDALNGFLMQETNFPFEIIVHDDASTDNTAGIIKKIALKYPKIIKPIFQPENIYAKGMRPPMFTFPKSKGKYIAFCEGDDYWVDQKKLAIQVEFLEQNPEYVICYTDSTPFQGEIVLDKDFGGARKDLSQDDLVKGISIYTLTTCFRNIVDAPPELSAISYGDIFLWARLGKYGKGKYLKEITPSMYRVHSGGVHSSSSSYEQSLMRIQSFSAMSVYFKRLGDTEMQSHYIDKTCFAALLHNDLSPQLIPLMKLITKSLRSVKRVIVKR